MDALWWTQRWSLLSDCCTVSLWRQQRKLMHQPQGKLLHRSSCATGNWRLFLFFQSWTKSFIPAFKISKFAIQEAVSEASAFLKSCVWESARWLWGIKCPTSLLASRHMLKSTSGIIRIRSHSRKRLSSYPAALFHKNSKRLLKTYTRCTNALHLDAVDKIIGS